MIILQEDKNKDNFKERVDRMHKARASGRKEKRINRRIKIQ